jgi:hypothetical protein
MNLKEYTEIIKKWLKVRKRENVKGLLRSIDIKVVNEG